MTLTPGEYKNTYQNLTVNLPDGRTQTVSVSTYQLGENKPAFSAFESKLNGHHKLDTDLQLNLVPIRQDTPTTTQVVPAASLTPKQIRWMAYYVFAGKGSPETCQIVLQLAYHWKIIPKDQNGQADLTAYAAKLGLDCNGFVGNYLWHVIHKNAWPELGQTDNDRDGPSRGISHYLHGRHRVTRWEDLRRGNSYILGRVSAHNEQIIDYREGGDPGHITITDPDDFRDALGNTSSALCVVESTGSAVPKGLSRSYYSLDPDQHLHLRRHSGRTRLPQPASQNAFFVTRESIPGPHHQLHFAIVRAPDPDPD